MFTLRNFRSFLFPFFIFLFSSFFLFVGSNAVFAVGLTPPAVPLSTISSATSSEIKLVRGAGDASGDLVLDVSAHGTGSEYFVGASTFTLLSGFNEGTYHFQMIPTASAKGDYSVQIDFLVERAPSGIGSTVISGATAIVTFSVAGSSGGSAGGGGSNPGGPYVLPVTRTTPTPVLVPTTPAVNTNVPIVVIPTPSVQPLIPTKPSVTPSISPSTSNPSIGSGNTAVTAPTMTQLIPSEAFSTSSPNLSLSTDTTSQTFSYSINTSPVASLPSLTLLSDTPIVKVNLPDGIYYLHVAKKNDKTGTVTTKQIIIDTTPPDILDIKPETQRTGLGVSNVFLTITAKDKTTSVVQYKVTSSSRSISGTGSRISLGRLILGKHVYQIHVVDAVGNIQTVVATVTVEKESYLDTISRLFRRFFHL